MNIDRRYTWFLVGSLVIAVAFGFAWSAPAPAAAQGPSTPTLEPPAPRTPPPGPRGTPTPVPASPTPQPTGAPPVNTPESTLVPTPVFVPVTGGAPRQGDRPMLFLTVLSIGLALLAIGFTSRRGSRAG